MDEIAAKEPELVKKHKKSEQEFKDEDFRETITDLRT